MSGSRLSRRSRSSSRLSASTLFGLTEAPHGSAEDREPAVSGHARALPARHGSGHPRDLALHARQPGDLRDLRNRLRGHRLILDLPYPLATALIAGILDLVPNIGATLAGIIIGIVALSVSLEALIVFVIVILVYQQIENYILQPTIIGKAPPDEGFTVLASGSWCSARSSGDRGDHRACRSRPGSRSSSDEITAPRRARRCCGRRGAAPPF